MQLIQWIAENRELSALIFGMLVNLLGLAYNIYKLLRSGKQRGLACWLKLAEAARLFEEEAEADPALEGAEKLDYVLRHLREYAAELGCAFDEEALKNQVEADIDFCHRMNAEKSERLE